MIDVWLILFFLFVLAVIVWQILSARNYFRKINMGLGITKKQVCQVCGRQLTKSNRGSVDKDVCIECEHDRATEEHLEEL